jgi:hypothetical protein
MPKAKKQSTTGKLGATNHEEFGKVKCTCEQYERYLRQEKERVSGSLHKAAMKDLCIAKGQDK